MKTAREYFETFPLPYSTEAINNASRLDAEYQTQKEALEAQFTWKDSPQGHDYWELFYHTLHEKSEIQLLSEELKQATREHITISGLRFEGLTWPEAKAILEKYGYVEEKPF